MQTADEKEQSGQGASLSYGKSIDGPQSRFSNAEVKLIKDVRSSQTCTGSVAQLS